MYLQLTENEMILSGIDYCIVCIEYCNARSDDNDVCNYV